jgi:hypothetical protein
VRRLLADQIDHRRPTDYSCISEAGDFHGDLRAARRALELAGVLSSPVHCAAPDRWVGGSTVFVQVGDILDRGDDEIAIMSLLAHLARQASPAGGALYQVRLPKSTRIAALGTVPCPMQYKMIMHLLFQQVTYLPGAISLPGHMWWKTHLVMVVWTSA